MQTLGAIAHADYNAPGSYSYEEAAMCCFRLGLMMNDIEQLFRRMVFNIMAVNQDDHVKNISFLMNRRGIWSLAPAYDVTFAWNPSNYWLSSHQMSVNGKRSEIGYDDIAAAGRAMDISASRIDSICNEVRSAVNKWPEYARAVNIREDTIQTIDNVMQQNCID